MISISVVFPSSLFISIFCLNLTYIKIFILCPFHLLYHRHFPMLLSSLQGPHRLQLNEVPSREWIRVDLTGSCCLLRLLPVVSCMVWRVCWHGTAGESLEPSLTNGGWLFGIPSALVISSVGQLAWRAHVFSKFIFGFINYYIYEAAQYSCSKI